MSSPISTIVFQATGSVDRSVGGHPTQIPWTATIDEVGMISNPGDYHVFSQNTGIYLIKVDVAWTLATPDAPERLRDVVGLFDGANANGIIIHDTGINAGETLSYTESTLLSFTAGSYIYFNLDSGSTRTVTATLTIYGWDGVTAGIQAGTDAARIGWAPGELGDFPIVNATPFNVSFDADPATGLPSPSFPMWQAGLLFEGNPTALHAFGGANPDRLTVVLDGSYKVGYSTYQNLQANGNHGIVTVELVKNGTTVLDTQTTTVDRVPIGPPPPPATSSIVDVSGQSVTWVSGDPFDDSGTWTGAVIYINGFYYSVGTVTNPHSLTLYPPGGPVQTGVVMNGPTAITAFTLGDQIVGNDLSVDLSAGDYLQVNVEGTCSIESPAAGFGAWNGDADNAFVLWVIWDGGLSGLVGVRHRAQVY